MVSRQWFQGNGFKTMILRRSLLYMLLAHSKNLEQPRQVIELFYGLRNNPDAAGTDHQTDHQTVKHSVVIDGLDGLLST